MKKLILCFALMLGGCSTLTSAYNVVTGASITQAQAYIAANAWDAIETTAITYLHLSACVAGGSAVCRTQSVVAAVVPAIRIGNAARTNLIATVVANGTAPVSLYTALTNQTSTLQQIETTYGIGATQ